MTELHSQIREIIETEDVALFMKGTPQFVMCGNSHRALEALRRAGAPVNFSAIRSVEPTHAR